MSVEDLVQSVQAWLDALAIRPLAGFWESLGEVDRRVLFVLLVIAAVSGLVVGRRWPTSVLRRRAHRFQNQGEAAVSRILRLEFLAPDYHLMNHVTLRMDDGTTQVDHILVSRFGVFVIETKHYSGWIFANPQRKTWTQVWFKARFRFQNPIFQNQRHVRAVQDVLGFLPPTAIRSLVVFTGTADFKTGIPKGVIKVAALAGHIRMHQEHVMSVEKLRYCVGCLETARLAITRETDVEHVESLGRRHGLGAA